MKIPITLKNFLIAVIGIFIIVSLVFFLKTDTEPNNSLPSVTPEGQAPYEYKPVDYSRISDPDVLKLFRDFEKVFPLGDLYADHVLTIFEGSRKTEYTQYNVSFGDFTKLPVLSNRLDREQYEKRLADFTQFFSEQKYHVDSDTLQQYGEDLNTNVFTAKDIGVTDLGCRSSVSNWPVSVLVCQTQVPDWNEINNQFAELNDNQSYDFAVRYISGDYAKGEARGPYGGEQYEWLAVKQDGKWIKVAQGQEWKCGLIEQYKIPIEIYQSCIN